MSQSMHQGILHILNFLIAGLGDGVQEHDTAEDYRIREQFHENNTQRRLTSSSLFRLNISGWGAWCSWQKFLAYERH